MKPSKFRKKPIQIEAMQWDGSRASIVDICGWANDPADDEATIQFTYSGADDVHDVTIATLEGYLTVSPHDFVIRGVAGEYYPCKPDIFAATYEAAE